MFASPIDRVNCSLSRAFRGYDVKQTDRLVQDLADALTKARDEKVTLISRLAELETKLVEYKQREASIQQTLIASQRMGEELRVAAQKEARITLEKARLKADELLQNAQIRLARILEEMAQAQKAKVCFETQLKNVIQDHLRLLDLNRQQSASLDVATTRLAHHETPGGNVPFLSGERLACDTTGD